MARAMKLSILLLALAATPAFAAERTLSATEFDRIHVEGGFIVQVTTGKGPSARISGSPRAIERTSLDVQDRMLTVRPNASAWGGWPGEDTGPVTVKLTTPMLRSVWVSGSGSVTVDRMRAPDVRVTLDGSGKITVAEVTSDRLDALVSGAGSMTLAGKAAQMQATVRGTGNLDADALLSSDAKVTAQGSGTLRLAAARTAEVTSTGTGDVVIVGMPACTVRNSGSGTVTCGAR